jgi:hypothetical protein
MEFGGDGSSWFYAVGMALQAGAFREVRARGNRRKGPPSPLVAFWLYAFPINNVRSGTYENKDIQPYSRCMEFRLMYGGAPGRNPGFRGAINVRGTQGPATYFVGATVVSLAGVRPGITGAVPTVPAAASFKLML